MAKLYYGGGNCSIEGSNIRGVQIQYTGAISITDKTSDSFAITHQKNGIMIFPIGEGFLSDLFDYEGKFKITSIIVYSLPYSTLTTPLTSIDVDKDISAKVSPKVSHL